MSVHLKYGAIWTFYGVQLTVGGKTVNGLLNPAKISRLSFVCLSVCQPVRID